MSKLCTKRLKAPSMRHATVAAATFVTVLSLDGAPQLAQATPPTISISEIPLTIPVPAHPQVLFALGNSESMDGNLSGAIMTGSGSLPASLMNPASINAGACSATPCGLGLTTTYNAVTYTSSSPSTYTVPTGFTAPISLTAAGNAAAYTVNLAGRLYDNSNSRLNVSKAGIASILQTFLPEADFALIDYQDQNRTEYTTWVYDMSPSSGFTFQNTPPASGDVIINPCWNVNLAAAYLNGTYPLNELCNALNAAYPGITGNEFMIVNASSDDPDINDVLYTNGFDSVFTNYGQWNAADTQTGPHPASEFSWTLTQYNDNQVEECLNESVPYETWPNTWGWCETPTNAGYVPASLQVINLERGFGYDTGSQTSAPTSQTSWPALIAMTSAGQVPTQTSMNTAIAVFTPYLAPETNNNGTTEIKAEATQSPIAGLLEASGDYFSHANPASSNGCPATRYTVLVTDGLPTEDLSAHSWPPLGTLTAAGPWSGGGVVSATFNGNGSLASTNDQALTDTVNTLQNLTSLPATSNSTAGVETYVIGVGAGVQASYNPQAAATLTAMAYAGGTTNYFAATTEAQLNSDMQAILAQIVAQNQSTASTAVNTTGLNNGSVAYIASFLTRDTSQDWTGDLRAYPITTSTGTVNTSGAPIWSAKTQLDAQTWLNTTPASGGGGRWIATWDPTASTPQGIAFQWNANAQATTGIAPNSPLGQELETFLYDMNGQDVLQYIRGSKLLEQQNGGQFRNRAHRLGDIVSSAPLYIGAPQGYSQAASYFTFVSQHATRAPIIYIGANDGMLHAFDATLGYERFAYIPNGVFANLVNLVNPFYNEQHRFYVNGSPVAADVQYSSDNSWHTILVGSEGAGGKSLFALDVSSADQVASEAQVAQMALWEFTDTDLGYTFSQPMIANTNAGWLVFAGNGYDSTNGKPVLYALNPQTGAIVEKIDLCAQVPTVCNMGVANGLSSVTVVNSYGESSLPSDRVYAGDLQGNLWRIDISNATPSQWVVSTILKAEDAGNNAQPITTAPAVTLNPAYPLWLGDMVYVGTGQMLGIADLGTTQMQTVYGVYDAPTNASYAPPTCTGSSTYPCTLSRNSTQTMIPQVMTYAGTIGGVGVRVINPVTSVAIPKNGASWNYGWFVDFNLISGERIVVNPELEAGGGLVVSSYVPNSSECVGGGSAWLQVFNYATGGGFTQPELDVSGDATLGSNDQINGQNPVGMALGNVFASAATLLSTNTSTGAKLNNLSNLTIKTVIDRGRLKKRIGWWEVRH